MNLECVTCKTWPKDAVDIKEQCYQKGDRCPFCKHNGGQDNATGETVVLDMVSPCDAMLEHWQALTVEQRILLVQQTIGLSDETTRQIRSEYANTVRLRGR